MRKIIAALLGLLSVLLYAIHALYAAVLMVGLVPFHIMIVILGIVLVLALLIHAILIIPFALKQMIKSGHYYLKVNFINFLQFISGVLLIVFTLYHSYYLSHQPNLISLIFIILTLAAFGIHLYFGVPRAFITLGYIREESDMRKAKIISFFLTILPTLIAIIAFILYYPHFYTGG